ncbi:hypothetical protein BV898_00364 [Hypsibius exemplaris]|uniref:Intradiol ring-cleavage dioxygenases domain-containing protein n=1 Tax=Hypsibius exemplaris TaxID=2072580 RepID=A0A1W0XFI9_HYPEX|nr:hypothetical protein BV898_00364 [Hypsibius exemplaris]
MLLLISLGLVCSYLVGLTGAHLDDTAHGPSQDRAKRQVLMTQAQISLAHCSSQHHSHELHERARIRRGVLAESIRRGRFEKPVHHSDFSDFQRQAATLVAETSHHSNRTGLTTASDVFSGGNVPCLLSAQSRLGPFYVSGELIRRDIREDQPGIDLYVDFQFIDINTCRPVADLYVDVWHGNASAVYSGVPNNGNQADRSNFNKTFLRGIYPTNTDGVAQIITKFPGHYKGQATHIHLVTHLNGTVYANRTFSGGAVQYVGQLFLEDQLVVAVNELPPYNANLELITANADDYVFTQQTFGQSDPVAKYVLLGDRLEDGLLAWIPFGIDTKANESSPPGFILTAEGGVVNPDFKGWMPAG